MKPKTSENPELLELTEINKKLEVVIALLLRSIPDDIRGLSLKEQIRVLDNLGIRPVKIAQIVGKTPTHVSKELVAIRRGTHKS